MRVSQVVLEAIEAVDKATTRHGVVAKMKHALASVGRNYFCLNLFPQPDQNFVDAIVACELPPAWLELYLRENFVSVDPSIRHCKKVVLPFSYRDAPYDATREPRAVEVVNRARDFGVCNGFIFPIPGPIGSIGDMWVGGTDDPLSKGDELAVQMLALYAFYKIQQLIHPKAGAKVKLSEREREVLTWVAAGKTAWEIGELLNISQRTVEWHIQHAAQKLGARNRMQAVVIAARDRLIEI
jgi:DNA-binding CsgD family transcriptional regulator